MPTPELRSLAEQNPLIATGNTVWRYLDDGSIPASWNAAVCDDSGWKTAAGSIGAKYGELQEIGSAFPENLLNQYMDDGKTNVPAVYFRADFTLENAEAVRCIEAQIEYDDAVTVYINGEWVFEANTLVGGYGENEYGASDTLGSPNRETIYIFNADILKEGKNTISVELRQASDDSSDIFFDFISLSVLDEIPQTAFSQNITDCLLLQLGDEPGNLRVTWTSERLNKAQRLFWEEAQTAHDGAFSAACRNLAPTIEYFEEADLFSYSVDVTGVASDTEYVYGIGEIPMQAEYTHKTPAYDESFEFIFAGDPQMREKALEENTAQWTRTLELAYENMPRAEFVISAGDQVNTYDIIEEYWAFAAPEPLRVLPVATVKGNHDEGGDFYNAHFAREGFYWFQYGKTLFVTLNTNSKDYARHEAFLQTAREEYLAQNGVDPQWLIVLMHHAIYGVGSHSNSDSIIERRNELSDIFARHDVDLVLTGHDHTYARTFLMDGRKPDIQPLPHPEDAKKPGQTLYISAGSSSGSKYYPLTESNISFAAALSYEEIPQIVSISIDKERIKISAYHVKDGLTLFDEFTLHQE